MTNRLLRTPPLVGALLVALSFAACGYNASEPVTRGENESVNVQAGNLIYQVQISRALNPSSVQDSEFLEGLDPADADLRASDQFFGVWIRAENTTDRPQPAADEFRLMDAVGNEYEPIEIADSNPFKYTARVVEKKSGNGQPLLPDPNSGAGAGPIQGSLVLFKVPHSIYQNAPVEFEITPQEGLVSSVQLDM